MSEQTQSAPESAEPVIDYRLRELVALLSEVDEDDDFVELDEKVGLEVSAKAQELVKRHRSLGRALINKATDDLEFLLLTFIRADEADRRSYSKQEERKKTLNDLLWAAVSDGTPEIIEMLLRVGHKHKLVLDLEERRPQKAQEGAPDRMISAPFLAAEKNNWPTLSWLIRSGRLSLDVRGSGDETLFMAAVAQNQFEMADRILSVVAVEDRDEVINARLPLYEQTALHAAAHIGDLQAIAYLIARRADPDVLSSNGHAAAQLLPEEDEFTEAFNILEDYREAYVKGQAFAPPVEWYLDHEGNEPKWMTDGIPEPEVAPRATMAM
jgi:hypothetical protein